MIHPQRTHHRRSKSFRLPSLWSGSASKVLGHSTFSLVGDPNRFTTAPSEYDDPTCQLAPVPFRRTPRASTPLWMPWMNSSIRFTLSPRKLRQNS